MKNVIYMIHFEVYCTTKLDEKALSEWFNDQFEIGDGCRDRLTDQSNSNMNVQRRVKIDEIAAATGLSRATVDRVLNKRPGVHPRTHAHVLRVLARLENDGQPRPAEPVEQRGALGVVIQAGETFTKSVLETVKKLREGESRAPSLEAAASRSDEETIELIQSFGRKLDGLALVSKNIEPVKSALKQLRSAGKHVVALVSDLDATVRDAYIGIDNRAAGQLAAFILGRCLERAGEAKVAVVVGYFSFLCQEDREIGFRSLLRQRFPQIEIVEVVKGDDSREATYDAALRLLKNRPDIAGIYNVAGGNFGLAKAIEEARLGRRPVYIAHEANEVTEPLLRKGVIDFLISQNIESLVRTGRQVLTDLSRDSGAVRELNYLPVQVVTEFTLAPSLAV
jgi:LacI family transcriptional regulator